MNTLTLKQIEKKYGNQYFDLYKLPSWKKTNRNDDDLYEFRGVSKVIKENYNDINYYYNKESVGK